MNGGRESVEKETERKFSLQYIKKLSAMKRNSCIHNYGLQSYLETQKTINVTSKCNKSQDKLVPKSS